MTDRAAGGGANATLGNVVFFWENFGPMHSDRVLAVKSSLTGARVVGIELRNASNTYDWASEASIFEKVTLFERGKEAGVWGRVLALSKAFFAVGRGHYFLCHYDWTEVFIAAWMLRVTGSRVYAMGCSKFDDMPRKAWREYLKSFFLTPYNGAISSGFRSKDYLRFLGIPEGRVATEYNTVSVKRFRQTSGILVAPDGSDFEERDFISVARLVPKKNHKMLIDAFARYAHSAPTPRRLHLCGNGPLEGEIRQQVADLGLTELVTFHGFLQSPKVSALLAKGLCLLLPSIEEQFGNVVIEAQALGLPVILSDACGARDKLVRTGVNGFVVEPDNLEGMAFFMSQLASDSLLWQRMSRAAFANAEGGDVDRFAEAVSKLIGDDAT